MELFKCLLLKIVIFLTCNVCKLVYTTVSQISQPTQQIDLALIWSSGSHTFYIIPHIAGRNIFMPHLNKTMIEKHSCNFI